MTERFTLTNPKNAFQEMKCGIDDRGNTLTFNEVVDMLNAFNDENEHLQRLMRKSVIERLLNGFEKSYKDLEEENEQLKASLYAEKTNTAEVVNDYSKQFKRYSAQFSFMRDLADDLGVDVTTLEALDD